MSVAAAAHYISIEGTVSECADCDQILEGLCQYSASYQELPDRMAEDRTNITRLKVPLSATLCLGNLFSKLS